VLPGSGLDAAAFWRGFDDLAHALAPNNAALLAERERLQAEFDGWRRVHPGPVRDKRAYEAALRKIGHLVPVPGKVKAETGDIDRGAPIGRDDEAGVTGSIVESASTTIPDFEDSVAVVDADDKVQAYGNWLSILDGSLTEDPAQRRPRDFRRDSRRSSHHGNRQARPHQSQHQPRTLDLHRQAEDARARANRLCVRAVEPHRSARRACREHGQGSASWTRSGAPASISRPASPRRPAVWPSSTPALSTARVTRFALRCSPGPCAAKAT
jgi:hypothetical protein